MTLTMKKHLQTQDQLIITSVAGVEHLYRYTILTCVCHCVF